MARYWLETHLKDGTFVSRIPGYNLQFEVGFNGPTGVRWSTPMYHPQVSMAVMQAGVHEVWVMRNGVCVAAGPLWDIAASTDNRYLTCGAMTLEDYLDVRLIQDVTYTVQDQTAIAWNMITTSQAYTSGGLNIIAGTFGTGITRSISFRTYDEKQILEAIQDYSQLDDGFDFWIEPATRKFNAIWPRPQTNRGVHLVYPQHINSYAMTIQGKYTRNRIVVQGPDPAYAVGINTTNLSKYGLREYGDALKDASTSDDLTAYTTHLTDLRSDVSAYPTLVLRGQRFNIFDPNQFQFGDVFRVTINDGYINVDQNYRYTGAQVTVNNAGDETIVLYTQDLREL
jgi:hypothetical protein